MQREIGNPNQPLSNYITMRSSTPEMGPGWLNPKKVERRVSATPFSTIPRFSSTKQLTRQPRVQKEHVPGGSVALHFSRREFPRPNKLH
jgi:hypothetical protein